MQPIEAPCTSYLFAELHVRLMELLDGFDADDWLHPTVCGDWKVRDIVAHMLDTQLRLLSIGRDGHPLPASPTPIRTYDDLVALLNRLNREGVEISRRLSTSMLTSMIRSSGAELAAWVVQLDPEAPAVFPVAWAGEAQSQQWFDTGRNYTEYWHHQQQIRDAVGAAPLYSYELMNPVISLFMRALPRAYAHVKKGLVTVRVTGEAGGIWTYDAGAGLFEGAPAQPDARITLSAETFWRLFTNGLAPSRAPLKFEGDTRLRAPFLKARAVMV